MGPEQTPAIPLVAPRRNVFVAPVAVADLDLMASAPGSALAGSKPKPKNWTMPRMMRIAEATRTMVPR